MTGGNGTGVTGMKWLLLVAALAALAGCNTIDGVGQDISAGAGRLEAIF